MTAIVTLAGYRAEYPVLKRNRKTVLVALDDGNVVKRHMVKHDVQLCVHKGVTFNPVTFVERTAWWLRLFNWVTRR